MRNEHILVLSGGNSTEREVSLRSGAAVAEALGEKFARVSQLDPQKENLSKIASLSPDAVFIALHGKGGEDGSIQGLLDLLEIPYTGPGVLASAICMDKIMTKKVLAASAVSTPEFLVIEKESEPEKALLRAIDSLGLPLVLKSPLQGSSIGTVILRDQTKTKDALEELFSYGNLILAEKFLAGTELTVPVMGNEIIQTLPVIEIVSEGQFYDYESKYTPGQSHHILPARIQPEQEEKAILLAKEAYLATGCRGHARVDLMLDEKGDPFVIEINTSPGMTSLSLFPDAARSVGISFPELCEALVDLALQK